MADQRRSILGCTSSFFLTKEGARKLLNEMKRREGEKVMPIDMVIRECVHNKRLTAAVSLPFFSTISTDFDVPAH